MYSKHHVMNLILISVIMTSTISPTASKKCNTFRQHSNEYFNIYLSKAVRNISNTTINKYMLLVYLSK